MGTSGRFRGIRTRTEPTADRSLHSEIAQGDAERRRSAPTVPGAVGDAALGRSWGPVHRSTGTTHEEVPMPASKMPGTLKRSPKKAQRTYEKALGSAEQEYGNGERAHRTALSALKHSFEKVGDHGSPRR
jgi:hypothetical protein